MSPTCAASSTAVPCSPSGVSVTFHLLCVWRYRGLARVALLGIGGGRARTPATRGQPVPVDVVDVVDVCYWGAPTRSRCARRLGRDDVTWTVGRWGSSSKAHGHSSAAVT